MSNVSTLIFQIKFYYIYEQKRAESTGNLVE